jgi:hypothetical protein
MPPAATATPARLGPGAEVWVTTADGKETHGRLRSIDPQSLELSDRGTPNTVIVMRSVSRIEKPDSVGNGIAIGAAIGGAVAAVPAGLLSAIGHNEGTGGGGGGVLLVALGVGVGALLGWAEDASHVHREVVYRASGTHPAIAVVPLMGKKAAGMGVTVRW